MTNPKPPDPHKLDSVTREHVSGPRIEGLPSMLSDDEAIAVIRRIEWPKPKEKAK